MYQCQYSIPGEGNGNPLQYACLENPRDGSLVGHCLWGRTESNTTDVTQLSSSVLGCSQKCSSSGPWSLSHLTCLDHHDMSPYPPYTQARVHTHTLFPYIFTSPQICRFVSLIQKVPFSLFRPLTEAPKLSLTPLIIVFSLYLTAYVFMLLALLQTRGRGWIFIFHTEQLLRKCWVGERRNRLRLWMASYSKSVDHIWPIVF